MVLVLAALYSFAKQYRTESGETAAEVIQQKVDSVVQTISPSCSGHQTYDDEDEQQQPSNNMSQPQTPPQSKAHPKVMKKQESSASSSGMDLVMEPSPEVRNEWVNAIFGTDFCPLDENSSSSSKGANGSSTGLAGIAEPYVSYSVRIPPAPAASGDDHKLGITVCRLPLGLQVRKVQPHSEAALLGVQPGSVLVDLNGLCLLAEPTKQALERLWQYEGFLEGTTESSALPAAVVDEKSPKDAVVDEHARYAMRDPVAMTFIRDGQLKRVLFLSNPLTWGVSWASCGNFPLVKRVYSFAATAGVPRGCLVAAVQEGRHSFRTCDHADTAAVLRDAFVQQHEIHLTLCFPPSGARSDAPCAKLEKAEPPVPRRIKRTDDGVEIKFHSLELTLGGLCRPSPLDDVVVAVRDNNKEERKSLSHFAEEVAAGQAESPVAKSSRSRSHPVVWTNKRTYAPCPALPAPQLWALWDPLETLLFCLQFHCVAYREEDLGEFLRTAAAGAPASPIHAFSDLLSGPPHAADAFLLQILSVICSPLNFLAQGSEEGKKEEEASLNNTAKRDAEQLTSLLLKVSKRDEGFCQRLYFLLRSYISSMERNRPTTHKNHKQHKNKNHKKLGGGGGGSGSSPKSNLMSLLNCLELLRFAEQQLAGQIHLFNQPKVLPPLKGGNNNNNIVANLPTTKGPPLSSSAPGSVPSSASSTASSTDGSQQRRGLLKFLRKKGSSSRSLTSSSERSVNSMPTHEPKATTIPAKQPLIRSSSFSHHHKMKNRRNAVPRPAGPIHSTATGTTTSSDEQQQQLLRSHGSDSSLASQKSSSTPSAAYESMSEFLSQLDVICGTIEGALQRSFRQKIADWARQPWSESKESAVAAVTSTMRESLRHNSQKGPTERLLVNPVDSSELLASVDTQECYILPSAHFPILLTFNVSERRCSDELTGEERIYRTTVEFVGLESANALKSHSYVVHAAVAGTVLGSDNSGGSSDGTKQSWRTSQKMVFDTRSTWGAPQTLSLRLSPSTKSTDDPNDPIRFGWVDLSQLWSEGAGARTTTTAQLLPGFCDNTFDEHGDLPELPSGSVVDLQLKVTTEYVEFGDESHGGFSRKRMLLYKHDDDLRQEAFAVQFIRTCDNILTAAGLDMKLKTFQCIPVGTKRGFVEWVPGSVPLSEICQPFLDTLLETNNNSSPQQHDPSMFAKAGLTKYESLSRMGGVRNHPSESIRRLTANHHHHHQGKNKSIRNNPVQEYLRGVAYDADSPYLIRKSVMDTYIKSCAGYCVITYILGVGDRHLDNLLLHQSGSFFHCDYSFILGNDPKAYQPMRITEEMVEGMGGKDSDNYAKFLSLASAAFLAFRRPETVRLLLSLVRLMEASMLPDISENQPLDQAVLQMRDRLRLDLTPDQAVVFMEELIEQSLKSKMWLAVDAIHSLGKKF